MSNFLTKHIGYYNRQRKDSDKNGLSIYRNMTYSNVFQHYLNCLLFLTKAYKCKLYPIDKYKLYKQKGHNVQGNFDTNKNLIYFLYLNIEKGYCYSPKKFQPYMHYPASILISSIHLHVFQIII